jgi:predicted Fe-Mo cluster-binding NifX family protein
MKIAIASDNGLVTGHFGHCEEFLIYDIESGEIVNREKIPNPGHVPGFLPKFLNEQGVNLIISGGMGSGAVDIFNSLGIEVVIGARGKVEEVVSAYLAGKLESTGSICHEHVHEGNCE